MTYNTIKFAILYTDKPGRPTKEIENRVIDPNEGKQKIWKRKYPRKS